MIVGLLEKYFEKATLPRLYKLAAEADSPRYWKSAFDSAARLTPEVPPELALYLSQSETRSLIRFLVNTFKPEKKFPSAKDFAISIGYELLQHSISIKPYIIRKFAANVRREWCKSLNSHPIMKYYLKERRDIHPASIINHDASCDESLDIILSDVVRLRCEYIRAYSEPDGTDEVQVWIQNAEDYVDRSDDGRIIVPVKLHSAQGADFGFFRVWNDYSLIREGEHRWLEVCYHNRKLGAETAEFQGYSLGEISGPILWLL